MCCIAYWVNENGSFFKKVHNFAAEEISAAPRGDIYF
jgi:hypothetical protein